MADGTSPDLLPFVTRDFLHETLFIKTKNLSCHLCSLIFTEDWINLKEIFTLRIGLNICLF